MLAVLQEPLLTKETRDSSVWPFSWEDPKPPHFHPQIEFVLVMSGSARFQLGQQEALVHAGQLIWLLPGMEHGLLTVSMDCTARIAYVEQDVFSTAVSKMSLHARAEALSSSEWTVQLANMVAGRPVIELKQRDFDALLEACYATSVGPEASTIDVTASLMKAVAIAWDATVRDHASNKPVGLVDVATCRMLADPLVDRATLAKELGVSQSYLSRAFEKGARIGLARQRSRFRIMRFVNNVTRQNMNYLQAALEAGFGSYSQLHRVFQAVAGCNPRTYFTPSFRNIRANLWDM